jgi:hypothetical protein
MNHILIEFPVFGGALEGASISKPKNATSWVRKAAQQTAVPPQKTPGNENLGQLVGAAKRVLDYYGPVVGELSVEAKERDLFHHLERALEPFLHEAALAESLAPPPKPHQAKIHGTPKPDDFDSSGLAKD